MCMITVLYLVVIIFKKVDGVELPFLDRYFDLVITNQRN